MIPQAAIKSLFKYGKRKITKRKAPGHVPGAALFTGVQKVDEISIYEHLFSEDSYKKTQIKEVKDLKKNIESGTKQWIEVHGVHDVEVLQHIWELYTVHPLIREDIVSTSQRPKVEHYEDMVFMVLRMLSGKSDSVHNQGLEMEQVSIVLGKQVVISFQETNTPIFEPIYKRLDNSLTRLRRLGHDYTAYALMDTIVDHYFDMIDFINDSIESLEMNVLTDPKPSFLHEIHSLRRDLILFRKSVWSLRDGINSLLRDEVAHVSDEVKVFFRDVYDHIIQVIDSIENNREMVFSLHDMYMSNLSNKMNEVMKVLTIIATIFIPLTFVAGIYGMNFNSEASPLNMPELNWYYGYPASIAVMIVMVVGMFIFFKRKDWI